MPDLPRGEPNVPDAVWPGGPSLQGPHRVGAFAICPQLEAYSQDLRLRPIVEKESTAVGTLVHAGLAYRYAAMLPVKPNWYVYPDGRTAIWTLAVVSGRPDFGEEALRVFDAYEAFWKVNTLRPLLVEHQFLIQLEGEPYSCRIDLMAEENGEVCLIDHKTRSKFSSDRVIREEFSADIQMMTGLALGRAHGWDIRRVVINVLTKEYPEPRFKRVDIPISELAYRHLGEDVGYYLRLMKWTRQAYPDPMNRPRNWASCMRKYGLCDYAGLCTEGLSHINEFVRKPQ